MNNTNRTQRRRRIAIRAKTGAVAALCAAVAIAGCGGTKAEGGGGTSVKDSGEKPSLGGKVTYGIAAENADGWCLPEAQLTPTGIQVARSIYDTLAIPNKDGELVPFLAKSLTPNADFTDWDIELRDGITFHDGSALDSTVVKNNLDAFRGTYPARKPLLFRFVFDNVADVQVTGPLSLKVTTKTPWSSLPAVLWSSGRVGIMAQAQLDDQETCDTKLIGTGPFELVNWAQNEKFVAKKNPNYWQKDSDGTSLPYLDEIEYRPVIESSARTNALIAGELNALNTFGAQQIEALETAEKEGKVINNKSDKFSQVNFVQLNNAATPFDNKNARLALIYALDMQTLKDTIGLGRTKIANGPFSPGNIGYLKDTGYPTYDLAKAKEYAAAFQADTGRTLEFSVITPPDQTTQATVALLQEMLKKAGISAKIVPMEVSAMVSAAVAGKFEAMVFQNFPGGDPDDDLVWWYGKSPVNLSRFDDPEINRLLDEGRATADVSKRKSIYEEINRRFGSEGYSAWLDWVIWDVATAPNVHGVIGPKLPNGDDPSPSLALGHSTAGMWISKKK